PDPAMNPHPAARADPAAVGPGAEAVSQVRRTVAELHAELVRNGLVAWTSGNVSARVPGTDLLVIKPSGVAYADLTAESMVVCDLSGTRVSGELSPSSDTPSPAYIYRHMPAPPPPPPPPSPYPP